MNNEISGDTTLFSWDDTESNPVRSTIQLVYNALKERGYDPVSQLVGYVLSGDPTYITSHSNARALIRRLERDEILEELVRSYLNKLDSEKLSL
ncbi:MAG: IreB family regulatory phosphoprotein [Christensenellales bacterium]|jgi:uncharacterized protein (UPF0297 family)